MVELLVEFVVFFCGLDSVKGRGGAAVDISESRSDC